MLNIDLFNIETEEKLYNCVLVFNEMYETSKKVISELTYFDLYKEAKTIDTSLSVFDWKTFYQDERVREWYKEELELALEANIQKLSGEATKNKSSQTTLISLLNYKRGQKIQHEDQNKIFIYTHIPLNPQENRINNVRVLKTIPKEIGDAITTVQRDIEV